MDITKNLPESQNFSRGPSKEPPEPTKKEEPVFKLQNSISSLSSSQTLPRTISIPLKQPHHLLLDIWGVITMHSFRTDLYRYLENKEDDHLANFLQMNFHSAKVERFLNIFVLKNMADRENRGFPQLPIIGLADCCDDKRSKVANIVKNLRMRLQLQKENPSLIDGNIEGLFNLVWMDGYKTKKLRPRAFLDVFPAFRRWTLNFKGFLQLHTFASGPPENQALFLAASEVGDLATGFITSYFDASSFSGISKKDPAMYRGLLDSLGIPESFAGRLIYLTDSPSKGKAAQKSGLSVFIVRRPGNRVYQNREVADFTVLDSLEQLEFAVVG